jgi:hypothetical protein
LEKPNHFCNFKRTLKTIMKQIIFHIKYAIFFILIINSNSVFAQTTFTSVQNGNWTNNNTWGTSPGVVPTSIDNVVISAGDTVIVNNSAVVCNNISFVDNTAKLDLPNLNSRLNISGNFSIATTSHNPFISWHANASVRFNGTAALQTLTGWPSNSAPPFAFNKIIIQKTAGKVSTDGTGMRLGITDSLIITNGNFELAASDDIEGRIANGTGATQPHIIINAGDSLIATSAFSHIRSGSLSGDDNSKIGNLTINGGYVAINPGQTNRTNFAAIDVKAGGELEITGSGTNINNFNPGTINVDSAAIFRTTKDLNYWFTNATTPNTLVIKKGAELDFNGTINQNILPTNFTLNTGSFVRYSRTIDTISSDVRLATYSNVVFVGTLKVLSQNITVNDTLYMRTASSPNEAPILNLNGFTLTYNTGATLSYRGIGAPPITQTTGSTEWPVTGSIPTNVQIFNASGVTLNETKSITGKILFRGNSTASAKLSLSTYDLTANELIGCDSIKFVKTNNTGSLILTSVGSATKLFGVGNATYNPLTIANGSNLNWKVNIVDSVSVTDPLFIANVAGAVQRTWNILPSTNPPPAGADLTFQYNDGDPSQIGALFDPNKLVQIWVKYLTDWYVVGVTQTPTGAAGSIRTVNESNWSGYSPFAISNFDKPLPINLNQFVGSSYNDYNLITCNLTSATNVYLIELEYSLDNINFQKINSFTTPTLINDFKHFTNSAITYYRTKIFGDATHFMYSPIIKVKKGLVPKNLFDTKIANNVITVFNMATNKKLNYTINSLDGKKVMEGKVSNNQQINLNNLPKGMWFFVAEHNVVKFVVQ